MSIGLPPTGTQLGGAAGMLVKVSDPMRIFGRWADLGFFVLGTR